jgi:hypothetical protein
MELSEAIELCRGKPYATIFVELSSETVDFIDVIEGKDLRDVVTVLCSGIDFRLGEAPSSPIKSALVRAFSSMTIDEFGFNLTDPVVSVA